MKQSAGILLFKKTDDTVLVLLAHPGGPFWKNKDLGAWSIPKGEFDDDEIPLEAAIREFKEETGARLAGDFIELEPAKLKSGKIIFAWALERDFNVASVKSNEFELEWPPRSGKTITVPEIDKVEWFDIDQALQKINSGQAGLLLQLADRLG